MGWYRIFKFYHMNKKVTIEIDFESQCLNVSVNEAHGFTMD